MKKIGLSLILASLLAACASTPAPVTTGAASAPAQASETTAPVVTPKVEEVNPLTDPNNILSSRHVFFDFDSYVVKEQFNDLVTAHAKYLLANKNAKVILQGNTDNRGTAEYNLALGQKRADAVKKMMSALGVPESQLEAVSFGEEKPLESADTEEGWARNRRAEIVYKGE